MERKRCEILSVGTELLLGDTLNTNSHYLAKGLSNLGLDVYFQIVVGDNPQRLKEVMQKALERSHFLLVSGGLGPTQDDLTKEIAAEVFGKKMVMHEESLRELKRFYEINKRIMPHSNEKQAMMPEGAIVLKNPQGTAPGCILEDGAGRAAILMPGPPRELQPMFDDLVVPYLKPYSSASLVSRVVRVVGLGESTMAEMLDDLISQGVNPTVAPYARSGEAYVRITARAKDEDEAHALTQPVVEEVLYRLGLSAYGVDVENLESCVADLLKRTRLRVSFADCGTGALALYRLSAIEDAAGFLAPGFSAETCADLRALLHITQPISSPEETCAALAQAVQTKTGADIGLALIVHGGTHACAVTMQGSTITAGGSYLQSRDAAYTKTVAVNAAFDLLRRRLLDYLK